MVVREKFRPCALLELTFRRRLGSSAFIIQSFLSYFLLVAAMFRGTLCVGQHTTVWEQTNYPLHRRLLGLFTRT